jgi:hypothetical protein
MLGSQQRFEHGPSAAILTHFAKIQRPQRWQLCYQRTGVHTHTLQAAVLHPVGTGAPNGGQFDEGPVVEFIEKAARSHVRQLPIGPNPLPTNTQLSGEPVTTPILVLSYPLADLLELLARPASSLNLQALLHRCRQEKHSGLSETSLIAIYFRSSPDTTSEPGFL